METQHTPGPWIISSNEITTGKDGLRSGRIYLDAKGSRPWGKFIAVSRHHINESDEETEANARLIAAAPELLNALSVLPENTAFAHVTDVPLMIEKAANLLEIKAANDGCPEAHASIISALFEIAKNHRAAINKATGANQ